MTAVEVKDIDLPQEMKRAMARQAEAERERRAKVIAALGERQASHELAAAAATLSKQPMSLQLRYLQTVSEIATENNSTTLFPIPLELFKPLRREVSAEEAGEDEADLVERAIRELPAPDQMPAPSPNAEAAEAHDRP